MLRLLWGIVLGVLIGGAVAAILVKGLGVVTLGALAAYPLAVLIGAIAGLVAGKPIWAKDARIEAGLKAFFGALLAAGVMFALRSWAKVDLDLPRFGLGHGVIGELAVTSLPMVAVLLSLVFEVDNLFGKGNDAAADDKKRVAASDSPRLRAGAAEAEDVEAPAEADEKRASRRKS